MSDSSLLEKCCLIGPSVSGDPTHFVIERAFRRLGLDWRFLSFETAEDRLAEALSGLDALGSEGCGCWEAFETLAKPPLRRPTALGAPGVFRT